MGDFEIMILILLILNVKGKLIQFLLLLLKNVYSFLQYMVLLLKGVESCLVLKKKNYIDHILNLLYQHPLQIVLVLIYFGVKLDNM